MLFFMIRSAVGPAVYSVHLSRAAPRVYTYPKVPSVECGKDEMPTAQDGACESMHHFGHMAVCMCCVVAMSGRPVVQLDDVLQEDGSQVVTKE